MNARRETGLVEEALTHAVIRAFYDVHRELGFGFREYLYALALERELVARRHRVDRDVGAMVYYRGEPLTWQTLDMIVDEKIVLEVKATERVHPSAMLCSCSATCARPS
jgi:GxxExxY protein